MNATYLFEGNYDGRGWPPSSESFWTSVFAVFALHLGARAGQLTVWQCTNGGPNKKWYTKRTSRPNLQLANLDFDSVVVEPRALSRPWPGTSLVLPTDAGGFSPDIVIRSRGADGSEHFAIVENKVTSSACLADNQIENYPKLANWLRDHGLSFDILFLQSAGCSDQLYKQAGSFQSSNWGANFGILLWERGVA